MADDNTPSAGDASENHSPFWYWKEILSAMQSRQDRDFTSLTARIDRERDITDAKFTVIKTQLDGQDGTLALLVKKQDEANGARIVQTSNLKNGMVLLGILIAGMQVIIEALPWFLKL